MLARQLAYLAGAASCGVVLGATVPIAINSRADEAASRMASCALALLMAHHDRQVRAWTQGFPQGENIRLPPLPAPRNPRSFHVSASLQAEDSSGSRDLCPR